MTHVNLTLFDLAGNPVPLPAGVVRLELTVPQPPQAPPANSWAWWPSPAAQAVWTGGCG